MLIYILKNSWIPSRLESGIELKSHYDDNRQFSTFRRLAINTLKTELLWFSISKCWMASFPPAAPLTQHRSALERPWARVLGKKVISTTQGLGTVTQRQPGSSGQDLARIWYTQAQSQTRAKQPAQCSGMAPLPGFAWLSSSGEAPAVVQSMAWLSGACRGRMLSTQAGEPSGGGTAAQHRAAWAALHPNHGSRLSTRVPACRAHRLQFSASHPPRKASWMPACAKCSCYYPCFFITPVSSTLGGVQVAVYGSHFDIAHVMVHKHSVLHSSVRPWWKERTVKCTRKHLIIQMSID